MNLSEVLIWLFSGGGSVMAASWLLERSAWFQNIQDKIKKENIFFLISSVLGVGAYALITYFPEALLFLEPYGIIVSGIFGSVYLGNAFHKEDKQKQ